MNALWKCPKCGRVIREKNLPEFTIHCGVCLYDYHTERAKRCDRHREIVYMNISSS